MTNYMPITPNNDHKNNSLYFTLTKVKIYKAIEFYN